jgi:CheY-like chemotaxis protein
MPQPTPPPGATVARILVAEDDPILGDLLGTALRARGHPVDVVTDGLNAVRKLRSQAYGLVVLDVHLPEVDGHAAARLVHDLFGDGARPRLIAFTGGPEALAARLEASGSTPFDSVVGKPDGLPALLSAIDSNLAIAADLARVAAAMREATALREASVARRRRRLSPLAAVPALGMTVLFAVAFLWGTALIEQAERSRLVSQHAAIRTAESTALVEAVEDAEARQRLLLLRRTEEARLAFEAELQRIDRMLISAAPIDDAGLPGFEPSTAPFGLIESRLRSLVAEAEVPAAGLSEAATARGPIEALRDWAMSAAQRSHANIDEGLVGLQDLGRWIVGVLVVGGLYCLVNAAGAARSRWRAAAPPLEDIRWDAGPSHGGQQPSVASAMAVSLLTAPDAPARLAEG